MSQRGGSVESHIRFGDHVNSPLIPYGEVDVLLPLLKEESHKYEKQISPNGINLVQYLETVNKTVTDKRFLNTMMLGVLSNYLPIDSQNWFTAISSVFKIKINENITMFSAGKQIVPECELAVL